MEKRKAKLNKKQRSVDTIYSKIITYAIKVKT